jgi:hypothetical protein
MTLNAGGAIFIQTEATLENSSEMQRIFRILHCVLFLG